MAARQNFTLSGFSDLEAKLAALPDRIAKGAAIRGMRRAGNLIAEEQRRLAPRDDGQLVESIRVTARARSRAGLAEYANELASGGSYRDAQSALREARRGGTEGAGSRVSLTIGASAPHAHLVEFGTVERFHESGKSTGSMPAQPFIRPAFDNTKDKMLGTIKSELTDEIERTAKRHARTAAKGI